MISNEHMNKGIFTRLVRISFSVSFLCLLISSHFGSNEPGGRDFSPLCMVKSFCLHKECGVFSFLVWTDYTHLKTLTTKQSSALVMWNKFIISLLLQTNATRTAQAIHMWQRSTCSLAGTSLWSAGIRTRQSVVMVFMKRCFINCSRLTLRLKCWHVFWSTCSPWRVIHGGVVSLTRDSSRGTRQRSLFRVVTLNVQRLGNIWRLKYVQFASAVSEWW